jgi:hypothetical protein
MLFCSDLHRVACSVVLTALAISPPNFSIEWCLAIQPFTLAGTDSGLGGRAPANRLGSARRLAAIVSKL